MSERAKKHSSGPTRAPELGYAALPRGARDLLPEACRTRRAITQRLIDTFEQWGYPQVMTPSVEYYDVFVRGLGPSERARCVRFIEPGTGELATLRSDVTPQIARMVAQRHGGELDEDRIVRLSYAADVVRQPDGRREQAEYHQAGVELIGDGDPHADAELIALCHSALVNLGLPEMRIDLAHTAIAREILGGIGIPEETLSALQGLLARKDADGTRRLLDEAGVSAPIRDAVAALCNLYGPPSILPRARKLLHCRGVVEGLDRLQAVLDCLEADEPEAFQRVVLDLGEVRGFEYYTGLRLRVWAPGVGEPIVRGGRYNDLLGRYGVGLPATGFMADLDALEAALVHARVVPEGAESAAACLVVVDEDTIEATPDERREARRTAALQARAQRAEGRRAWIEVGLSPERAQELAHAQGADRLVMVGPGGPGKLQTWELRGDQWQPVSGGDRS